MSDHSTDSAQATTETQPLPSARSRPLEAIPHRMEGVEERQGADGSMHLRREVPAQGWIEKAMARMAGTTGKSIQVALDERAGFFWEHIDGQRNLFALSAMLRSRFRLTRRQSEEGTVLFVKMLMRRNLIRLEVHPRRGRRV